MMFPSIKKISDSDLPENPHLVSIITQVHEDHLKVLERAYKNALANGVLIRDMRLTHIHEHTLNETVVHVHSALDVRYSYCFPLPKHKNSTT